MTFFSDCQTLQRPKSFSNGVIHLQHCLQSVEVHQTDFAQPISIALAENQKIRFIVDILHACSMKQSPPDHHADHTTTKHLGSDRCTIAVIIDTVFATTNPQTV